MRVEYACLLPSEVTKPAQLGKLVRKEEGVIYLKWVEEMDSVANSNLPGARLSCLEELRLGGNLARP